MASPRGPQSSEKLLAAPSARNQVLGGGCGFRAGFLTVSCRLLRCGAGDADPGAPGHPASSDLESNVSRTETSFSGAGSSVCSGSLSSCFLFLELTKWETVGARDLGNDSGKERESVTASLGLDPADEPALLPVLALLVKGDFQGLDHFLRIPRLFCDQKGNFRK